MSLGMLCMRRMAIVAALTGGLVIAVMGAGICTRGLIWGGGACLTAVKAGITYLLA